ncbi:MAG TPA: hypothetical protein VFS43_21745 [Polyangiaceae bacterium]|nr:hypothetical protein [Polyangiaceae bacterium]
MSSEVGRLRAALRAIARAAFARPGDVVAVFVTRRRLPVSGEPWHVARAVVSRYRPGWAAAGRGRPPPAVEVARGEMRDPEEALYAALRDALESALDASGRADLASRRASGRARAKRARARAALEAHARLAPEAPFEFPQDRLPF